MAFWNYEKELRKDMGLLDSLLDWASGDAPNPFTQWANYEDKGQFAEYLIDYAINNNIRGRTETLKNVYIPMKNGKTTEIDVIMIHKTGVYVFESKNYSGWIFGDEKSKFWTQCLYNKQKNKLYNPIWQNQTHINALSEKIRIKKSHIYSYIVFSKRCELKKAPERTDQYTVIKRESLISELRNDISKRDVIYTDEQIDKLKELIEVFANQTEEVKKEHVKNIKKEKRRF